MRKINLRKILWYFILVLPLIAYVFCLLGGVDTTFSAVIEQFTLPITSSPVGLVLHDIFNVGGYLPMLTDSILNYFCYFVAIELVHIFIDFILFIPKLFQRAFEKLDKERDS